jgi:hypothetical protein
VRSGDAAVACRLMTPSLQARVVTGGPCLKVLNTLGPLLGAQLAHVKVGNASINGNTATVPVSTPQKSVIYKLEKVGGRWIISDIAGRASASAAAPSAGSEDPSAVVKDYVNALVHADYQHACADLSAIVIGDMRTQLGYTCPIAFAQAVKLVGASAVSDLKTARIIGVKTSGNTGTATLQTRRAASVSLKLVVENGSWKVGTPLFVGGCCG